MLRDLEFIEGPFVSPFIVDIIIVSVMLTSNCVLQMLETSIL